MSYALRAMLLMALLWGPAPAAAQTPADPVLDGYRRLYAGDKLGAIRHFENLLKTQPDDLAFRFGLLIAEHERLQIDVPLRSQFERQLDAFIDLAGKRYGRSTSDESALYYLAQAHLLRASYRLDFDKGMWGAARDGVRSKHYSETYLKIHPEHADAYLPLGLYNYFVELAPVFFKVVRFLLFLPSGNRTEGLKQIERVASQGSLLGPQAQVLLVEIYSQFEGRPTDAIAVGTRLREQYPANHEFAFAMADVYASAAIEDFGRAAEVYQSVADRQKHDASIDAATSHYNAIFGLADMRFNQWRLDDAIAALSPPIAAQVAKPEWVVPRFLLRRSNYRALMNDPAAAEDARRVQLDARFASHRGAATSLLQWIDQRKASGEAAMYAALIPANRLAAEGRWDEARRLYQALLSRDASNPQVRYRLAYLDFASGNAERALPVFAALAAGGRAVPEGIRAFALLHIGRTYDLAGRRGEARKAYQQVVDGYENQRAADAARVGLIAPYKRPALNRAIGDGRSAMESRDRRSGDPIAHRPSPDRRCGDLGTP